MTDLSSQDRTTPRRTWLGPQIYVETADDHTVVSWPGGHRRLGDTATWDELFDTLRRAIEDTYHPRPHVILQNFHYVR